MQQKLVLTAAVVSALAIGAGRASATTITFDEVSPQGAISGPYLGTGASFSAGNNGIPPGTSHGDPQNWQLTGTNGEQFLGFAAFGVLSETVTFANAISSFSADFARAAGSSSGESLTMSAYDGATLLGSTSVVFGAINHWSSLSLNFANITSIRWSDAGSGFMSYGVDNINFTAATPTPEPASLTLFGAGLAGLGWLRRRRGA